jgi:deazaflavin-dependent oxidoreductase (nitroreductase family)
MADDEMTSLLASLAGEEYCYLTTTGRVTGQPHDIEIWFGAQNGSLYLMAGNHRSDWVRNLLKDPHATVRIATAHFGGTARLVNDEQEDLHARYMLAEKYQEWEGDRTLSEWARTALVVAIEVESIL